MAASPTEAGTAARPGRSRPLGVLEIGRFLAAATVVVAHVCTSVPHDARAGVALRLWTFAPPGPLAVQFFFVLSGFVMAVAHGADRGRDWRVAGRFLWRRACRIYPMYWLALALTLAVVGMPGIGRLARLLTLWPAGTPEAVPPAWTLRYEVEFYLVFALALLPRVGPAVAVAWIAGTAANCFIPFECRAHAVAVPRLARALSAPAAGLLFSGVNFLFFAGVAAGVLHARVRLRPTSLWVLAVGGLLLAAGCLPAERWGFDFGLTPFVPPLSGAGIGAALAGLAGLERGGMLRPGRHAFAAGTISYPLYILHSVVLLLLSAFAEPIRLADGAAYALAGGLLLAMFAFAGVAAWGIDQPLQRRLRAWGRAPGRPTAYDLLEGEHR